MEIKKVFVVGTGQMGTGIAQVSAEAGYLTCIRDISESIVERARNTISENLKRAVQKGKTSEEHLQQTMANLMTTVKLEDAGDVDLVIEAVPEKMEIKQAIFKTLDDICPQHTIFCSNTSALPITQMASITRRPEQFIGTHFFYPVPIMKLIEIIKGNLTSDATHQTVLTFCLSLKKEIVTAKDYPGFLTTRLGMPFWNEALYALYEGQATAEEIDKAIKLSLNHPMGPLELMDFIGLDSILSIFQSLYEGYGEKKFFPCPLLVQMVQAGRLGRKSGRGFYDYTNK